MKKIIFDIETIGEDFDTMDEVTQGALTRWAKREAKNEEEFAVLEKDIKEGLGFSPLTGEIVSVGVLDYETQKGAVYFQAPGEEIEEFEEEKIKYKTLNEKEILENFWRVINHGSEFISFNGRSFDVPFLMIRSAIHKIRPSKDLMQNRYLNYQQNTAKHIDLLDQLTFYGAVRRRGNLHLWTRAFGIKSPKEDGVAGDDVARLFAERKFLEIARYNSRDLFSTRELFDFWQKYLRF